MALTLKTNKPALAEGVVHKLPSDLKSSILADQNVTDLWQQITPLARNEWICWVEDAKKPETRARRITIANSKLSKGMRRPCCWVGCSHRVKNGK